MSNGAFLAFVVLSMSAMTAAIVYEPPPSPPPPVATPGSGIMFQPFVFIDSETGCEYLSTHLSSNLTPRLAADGRAHKGCTNPAVAP